MFRVLDAPGSVVIAGTAFATLIGLLIIVRTCYQFYSGTLMIPQDQMEARRFVWRHVLIGLPLLLGGIIIFYLLVTEGLKHITEVSIATIGFWLFVRFLLREKKR